MLRAEAMVLVRERMTAPVVTQPPGASLSVAASVLSARAISAVPVVNGERVVGVLSITDLLAADRETATASVASAMTEKVVSARPDESIDVAARRLLDAHVHGLVVVEEGRAVGMLTARDLLVDVRQRRVPVRIDRLMSSSVLTVEVGDSVATAIATLRQARVRGLVVVDGGWPVGVFTQTEALASRSLPDSVLANPVEEVMSYETICLDRDTPAHRAAGYASTMHVRRLLVVEHRALVGVLSVVDLVRPLAETPA